MPIDVVKKSFNKLKKVENDNALKKFENWLKINETKMDGLYFQTLENNERNVLTSQDIPASTEPFMIIPLNLLITNKMGEEIEWSKILKQNKEFNERSDLVKKIIYVMLYILYTKRQPNASYQPYYDILPKTFDNFPIFWDENTLNLFKGSNILEMIKSRRQSITDDYYKLKDLLPNDFQNVTLNEFLECRTLVGSRNFGLNIHGEHCTVMVPLADMLNHSRPPTTRWGFDNTRNSYTMTAITDIAAEDHVFDSYGKKSNVKFLLHYGFTISPKDSSWYETRKETTLQFTININNKTFSEFIDTNIDSSSIKSLFRFLRKIVASENESKTNGEFYSIRNEISMLSCLALECRKKLSQYSTLVYNNYNKLMRQTRSLSTHHNIYNILYREQEILIFYIDLARNKMTKLLRMDIIPQDFYNSI